MPILWPSVDQRIIETMGSNSTAQFIKEERQAYVAPLRLKGATLGEIQRALAKEGKINHATGNAWSTNILWHDIKHIEKRWRDETLEEMTTVRGRVVAELRAVRRHEWLKPSPDMHVILKSLKQECEVLGLDAEKEVRFRFEDEAEKMARELGLNAAELIATAEEIAREAFGK